MTDEHLATSAYTAHILGAVQALFAFGAACGAITQGWLADWLGRKKSLAIAAVISLVGAVWTAGSPYVAMLVTVRILHGFGESVCERGRLALAQMINYFRNSWFPSCSVDAGSLMPVVYRPGHDHLSGQHLLNRSVSSTLSRRHVRHDCHGFWSWLRCVGFPCLTHANHMLTRRISCAWVSFASYYASSMTVQWRLPLALSCIGPLGLLIGLPFVPGKCLLVATNASS